MRVLSVALLALASSSACSGKSGPTIDQKGPFLIHMKGKKTIVDNVEWGKTEERNGMVGRKERDGTKTPLVTSGSFATKPFTADGKTVSIEYSFEFGKGVTGHIKLDDKTCEFDGEMFSGGGQSHFDGIEFTGTHATCKLDGEQLEVMFGPVVSKASKDDKGDKKDTGK